ncbi:Uncharacterised protein [Segatella copri]|nr:Uncharacterised protein [Segatella copri]
MCLTANKAIRATAKETSGVSPSFTILGSIMQRYNSSITEAAKFAFSFGFIALTSTSASVPLNKGTIRVLKKVFSNLSFCSLPFSA